MRNFWVLLKLNFRQTLCAVSGAGRRGKKKTPSGIGALCLIGGLSVYLSGLYSVMLADGLREAGQMSVLFLLMSVMAVGLCTMFTLFAAQGVVFGGKDNDLMLSMPVSAFTLLLSRVMALYLENLLCTALILLPAGVVYLAYGGGGGVLLLLRAGLAAVLLALLPTVLSLILGFFLSWLSSKFRKKALFTNLLYFGSFAVLMVFVFKVSFSTGSQGVQALAGIEEMLQGFGIYFLLTRDAICGSLAALPGLFALCVAPFLAVVWIFSTRYKSILTGLTAQSARSDYKLGTLTATTCRKALLRKEAGRFFGTPIYIFNAGFGLVMLAAMAVAAAFFKGKISAFLALLAPEMGPLPLALVLLVCVGFFLCTVAVTASAISLEGRQLWILREAPVSTCDIFTAKVRFQEILCLPVVVPSVLLVWYAFALSPADGILLVASCLLFSAAVARLGLLLNLFFPKMDAANDTMVVKNSMSAVVSLFANVFLLAVACLACYAVQEALGSAAGLLLTCLIFAAAAGLCQALLRTRGVKIFAEL